MKSFSFIALSALVVTLSACSTNPTSSFSLSKSSPVIIKIPAPEMGTSYAGEAINLGGFSGLMLKAAINNDEFIFEAITDRGPVGALRAGNERIFLLPEFSPRIPTIRVNLKNGSSNIETLLTLKKKNGSTLSGLPSVRTEENPIDGNGLMLSLDSDGVYPSAIVSDDEGGYWIADKYSPSLIHFNQDGKMIKRLTPSSELPKIYTKRNGNNGFEGIAKNGNKLFGFLQSSLPEDQNFIRIVEINLETLKTSNEYFYPIKNNTTVIKDAVRINSDSFLIVEENELGNQTSIYKITLKQADEAVKKEFLASLDISQKIEGIALADSRRIALITNNEFHSKENSQMIILEFSNDITK